MSDRSDPPSSSSSSTSSSPHPPASRQPTPQHQPSLPSYTSPNAIKPPTSSDTLRASLLPAMQQQQLPFAAVSSSESGSSQPLPKVAEKCLTFCSQRADGPPLCRMLCLRRRPVQLSREEEMARLRSKRDVKRNPRHELSPEASAILSTSPISVLSSIISRGPLPSSSSLEAATTSSSASSTADSSSPSSRSSIAQARTTVIPWAGWNGSFSPFASLRKALDPYSIIYVRGAPDGVVGRYMEEMEGDDGFNDFGKNISRHAKRKGRDELEIEYLDWGDEGAVLHLPLTSLFHPVLAIPNTVSYFLSPPLRLLTLYRHSFTDGSQIRSLNQFAEAITAGGAFKLFDRLLDHHQKKIKEREMEYDEMNAMKAAAQTAHKQPAQNGQETAKQKKETQERLLASIDKDLQNKLQMQEQRGEDVDAFRNRVVERAKSRYGAQEGVKWDELSVMQRVHAAREVDREDQTLAGASTRTSRAPGTSNTVQHPHRPGQKPTNEAADDAPHPHPQQEKRVAAEIDRLRTGTGGSGLRRKIEEAMERDEEFRGRNADMAGVGKSSGDRTGGSDGKEQ